MTTVTQTELKERADAYRVPLTNAYPTMTFYIASLDRESVLPSDEELAMIASYVEFKLDTVYRPHAAAQAREADYPGVGGHNTVTFLKRGSDDWYYRRFTWTQGPTYVPSRFAKGEPPPMSLEAVMDRDQSLIPARWMEWKAAHPDVFPVG